MTLTYEERIDALVTRIANKFPQLKENQNYIRKGLQQAIEKLSRQDLEAPGAYTPDQYLTHIENNLDDFAQFTP